LVVKQKRKNNLGAGLKQQLKLDQVGSQVAQGLSSARSFLHDQQQQVRQRVAQLVPPQAAHNLAHYFGQ